jgi:hypothetical protein
MAECSNVGEIPTQDAGSCALQRGTSLWPKSPYGLSRAIARHRAVRESATAMLVRMRNGDEFIAILGMGIDPPERVQPHHISGCLNGSWYNYGNYSYYRKEQPCPSPSPLMMPFPKPPKPC